jgi:hypothetical protein
MSIHCGAVFHAPHFQVCWQGVSGLVSPAGVAGGAALVIPFECFAAPLFSSGRQEIRSRIGRPRTLPVRGPPFLKGN